MKKLSQKEMKAVKGGSECPLKAKCLIYPYGPGGGTTYCDTGWNFDCSIGDSGGSSGYGGGGGGGGGPYDPYNPPGGGN